VGKLFIAWGPGIVTDPDFSHVFTEHWADGLSLYFDYHAGALFDDPDPFASQFFGVAVKTLLSGTNVVVMDQSFDDPHRRRLVERAFTRAFPDLVDEQVQVGGEPEPGGSDEAGRGQWAKTGRSTTTSRPWAATSTLPISSLPQW
jgi:hypothetical protein